MILEKHLQHKFDKVHWKVAVINMEMVKTVFCHISTDCSWCRPHRRYPPPWAWSACGTRCPGSAGMPLSYPPKYGTNSMGTIDKRIDQAQRRVRGNSRVMPVWTAKHKTWKEIFGWNYMMMQQVCNVKQAIRMITLKNKWWDVLKTKWATFSTKCRRQ